MPRSAANRASFLALRNPLTRSSTYLGMRPGDLEGKPYARHWNPEMAPPQPQVADALMRGPETMEKALPLSQAARLLEAGVLPLENGYTQRESGEIFVAVQTQMPGVTGPMFEWWMGWHPQEAQRYKLWHPGAHLLNGTREMHGDDPSLSDRDKYQTTHFVTEYVGRKQQAITITFTPAENWFPAGTNLRAAGTTALVCGEVRLQKIPITIGYLIHQIRERGKSGAEMRSRFWLGRPRLPGLSRRHSIGRALARSGLVSRQHGGDLGRDMVMHCAMEMNHLSSFLPTLYRDYHA